MNHELPNAEPPRAWINALDRADADIAAGQIVEGAVIHKMFEDALDRLSRRSVPKRAKATSS